MAGPLTVATELARQLIPMRPPPLIPISDSYPLPGLGICFPIISPTFEDRSPQHPCYLILVHFIDFRQNCVAYSDINKFHMH